MSAQQPPTGVDSPAAQPAPPVLWQRHPFAIAWVIAFALFTLAGWRYRWVPAYHDAILNWDAASVMATRPWFPFVKSYDTGHPPLMAWLLSLLWQLPVSRFVSMHLLGWATAALLVASVFSFARRCFGMAVGLGAALLICVHPGVVGQSLQLNLDLPMAACGMAAMAAAAAGNPVAMAVAMSALCLTKLNGMFGLGPFMLYAFFGCLRNERWKSPRTVANAFWPMTVALGVFVVYHGAKAKAVGHVFDSGEFAGGQQVAFCKSLEEYGRMLYHSFYMAFRDNNGDLEVLAVMALAALIVAATCYWRRDVRTEAVRWLEPTAPEVPGRFWSPLPPAHVLLLLWLMAVVQIGLQSSRNFFTLVRYFIIVYPTIHLTALALVSLAAGRSRGVAVGLATAPLAILLMLKWHPDRVDRMPSPLANAIRYPRRDVPANGENSILFIDFLRQLQRAAKSLAKRYPEGCLVDAPWPATVYFSDPSHGITKVKFEPAWRNPDQPAAARVDTWINGDGRKPETLNPPGYYLARTYRKGGVWVVIYLPEGVSLVPPGT